MSNQEILDYHSRLDRRSKFNEIDDLSYRELFAQSQVHSRRAGQMFENVIV